MNGVFFLARSFMKSTCFLFLAATLCSAQALAAPPEKVAICHFSVDSGTWSAISIAAPAVDAHLRNHDDAILVAGVGGTTSQTGTALDANCVPVVVAPASAHERIF